MRNHIINSILAILLLFVAIGSNAQNNQKKSDDLGRIALSPFVTSNANIPEYAVSVMNNKLSRIAAKHGMASTSIDNRFVMTANMVEISKDVTASAPPMISLTLSPTIYIGDGFTGELFASCEMPPVKGVGDNETKAYLDAIKSIQANNPAVVKCIDEGKKKIIEFYNSQIDFLLAEAESMAKSQNFDEAMCLLASVPTVCKDAYLKAYEKIGEVYQRKIDLEGDILYNEAYAQWNTAKTQESAQIVVELLAQINPISSAAAKGRALVAKVEAHYNAIAAWRREIEERNWAFKMQQYEDKRADEQRDHEFKVQQHNDQVEYQMQKSNFDYEVQMEHARNGGAASEYALQEVKSIVSVMSNKSSGDGIISKLSKKISSWF